MLLPLRLKLILWLMLMDFAGSWLKSSSWNWVCHLCKCRLVNLGVCRFLLALGERCLSVILISLWRYTYLAMPFYFLFLGDRAGKDWDVEKLNFEHYYLSFVASLGSFQVTMWSLYWLINIFMFLTLFNILEIWSLNQLLGKI